MLRLVTAALVGVVLGLFIGLVSFTTECPKAGETYVISSSPPLPPTGKSVSLKMDTYGRFDFEGKLNGTPVPMFLDTGATSVVIGMRHAKQLGIRVSPRDFTGRAQTASGIVRFARTTIDSIQIGDVVVRNIPVAVQENDLFGSVALGTPFISRLQGGMEIKGGTLLLKQ